MPSTLRDIRESLGNKLGGFRRVNVSISPDITDTLAGRSVLSAELYDSDRNPRGYAGTFSYVGKYRDQRRVRETGYRSLNYAVYNPPSSGTYTITLYGFGITGSIAFDATASTVESSIVAVGAGLGSVTVSGGSPFIVSLPDAIDIEISSGTLLAQGGIGAVEVNRGFTRALTVGDEVEFSNKLPILDSDNVQGLNTIINMALKRMWFIDRFPITTTTNSLGVKNFYGLTNETWLTHKSQLIAVFSPVRWELISTLTPPGSGTFTITVDMGIASYITNSIAFNATGATIESELNAASDLAFSVSPQGASSSFSITLPSTYYAQPSLAVSAGTVTNAVTMLESPARYSNVWHLQYDGESPYLDNVFGQEGESFLLEASRPGHTWIAPQSSYGVVGTTWESSTTGLFDDYDQCALDAEEVGIVAYAIACRQLASIGPANEVEYWQRETIKAEREAAGVKAYDLQRDDMPRGGLLTTYGGYGSKNFWGKF